MNNALHFSDKVKIAFLALLWLGVIAPVVPAMIRTWLSHSDNTHAILVPFIALYFAWAKHEELKTADRSSSLWGGVVLTLCLVFYLLCYVGGVAVGTRLMIVGSLIGLIWNCFGWHILRVLAFPLGFLFFMVPVPDTLLNFVSFPLQLQATKISTWVISLFSIPVYREGNMLYFVQTQLEVAEACSGIRSIVSLTMLSILLAYLTNNGSWWKKMLLVACAIPVALVANILRVSGTGILAHFYGDKVARGFLHDFSGLVVFVIGFAVMFFIVRLLNLTDSPTFEQ
jgi:exosortase